ncbi:response regulator transcription factor [Paeniroseomonas aquatica]|uniref:Response regulator transcription factor n=1 Tax=Paeniroseomonas aquatica TaxID=373043 RepID=A0ABT8A6I5_9PROT|nr:response regulator transcription factor [Paeniroseomonas aquatica]MDN3565402.1 response regulator transcription factor [Paeniroseomonas aquatica]
MHILLASLSTSTTTLVAGLADLGIRCDEIDQLDDLASVLALSGPYDALLLRLDGPTGEAQAAVCDLRRRGLAVPVAILCGRSPLPAEEEALLHAGADDVLHNPIHLRVLLARLQALARRARGHSCARLLCGNVVLDQAQHAASVDGRRVPLTAREFDFLETLMLHKGVLLTKERFMTNLYADGTAPDSKIVDVFVCKLRRKLAECGAAEMIRTVWGRGYVAFEPSPATIESARRDRRPEAAIDPVPRGWTRRSEVLATA